jgi:hypothetical protein
MVGLGRHRDLHPVLNCIRPHPRHR